MRTLRSTTILILVLLIFTNCSTDEPSEMGTRLLEQIILETNEVYILEELFIPPEEFQGLSAGQIKESVMDYKSDIDNPLLDKWRISEPGVYPLSIFIEADSQRVFVLQVKIGPSGLESVDGVERLGFNIEDSYLTNRIQEIWVERRFISYNWNYPENTYLQADVTFQMNTELSKLSVNWFGKEISWYQIETSNDQRENYGNFLGFRLHLNRSEDSLFIADRGIISIRINRPPQ